jgi:hypothetical protein
MSAALSQPTLAAPSSPPFCDGRTFSEVEQAVLWTLLQQDPQCTSRDLLGKAAEHQIGPRVSLRHLNRWRVQWQRSRVKGRPCGFSAGVARHAGVKVVCVTPRLSFVGVHLFARWLDQQQALEPVVMRLKEALSAYQEAHPDDDFALLHHHDRTLKRRFAALVLAPLLEMERLSAFDTQAHPMETLIGQGDPSTTLSPFLGQLERIEAASWLMPILLAAQGGQLVYVDGHMIAYGSRKAMHKGKITMRGRIMAGSQAVISHDESGQAVSGSRIAGDKTVMYWINATGLSSGNRRVLVEIVE